MASKVQLKYKNLKDHLFIESLKVLVNHKTTDLTVSYRLKRILDLIDSESNKAQNMWNKLAKEVEYLPTDPNNEKSPKIPKDPLAFAKMEADFEDTLCEERNIFKLSVNDIVGASLSAVDLLALDPVLEGWEVLEPAAAPIVAGEGKENGQEKDQSN